MAIKAVVTGGTGHIGSEVLHGLVSRNIEATSLQRRPDTGESWQVSEFDLGKIQEMDSKLLRNADVVIHCAALVHETSKSDEDFFSLNYQATRTLYEKAREQEVSKFIFLSTVGVFGVSSSIAPITLIDGCFPQNTYSKSKYLTEQYLLSQEDNVEIFIVRLPLVYGNVKSGSFGALKKLCEKKIPLPFLGITNRRSMISGGNVAKAICDIVKAPKKSGNHLLLLAESEPYSTEEIVRALRAEARIRPMLFRFPKSLFRLALRAIGKSKMYEQLFENLEFESSIPIQRQKD